MSHDNSVSGVDVVMKECNTQIYWVRRARAESPQSELGPRERGIPRRDRVVEDFHYIAGNHDFHVLKLQGRGYPINFLRNLALQQDGVNCRFVHGWEFDKEQREWIMESLCHAMSDQKGDRDTNIWAAINRDKGDLTRFFSAIVHGSGLRRTTKRLQLDPQERLKETLTGLERKARSTVQPGEVLVFGHTHRPFVNKAENLANTGSWITTAPIHNTFVRLEGGKPRLFAFEGTEITERADI